MQMRLWSTSATPEVMSFVKPPLDRAAVERFIVTAGKCHPPLIFAVDAVMSRQLIGHVIFHPLGRWTQLGTRMGTPPGRLGRRSRLGALACLDRLWVPDCRDSADHCGIRPRQSGFHRRNGTSRHDTSARPRPGPIGLGDRESLTLKRVGGLGRERA